MSRNQSAQRIGVFDITELGEDLRYPCLRYLAVQGKWLSEDDIDATSSEGLIDEVKQNSSDEQWKDFETAVQMVSDASPRLTLKKIQRYCANYGITDVDLTGTKKMAIVSLYLGNPEGFAEAVSFCETYRMGSRELFSVKTSRQSKLMDFDHKKAESLLERELRNCEDPSFKDRKLIVRMKKSDEYWKALIYYEQNPRTFRIFKGRKIESLEVRPAALLQFECFEGNRLAVKGRGESAIQAAIPIISRVLTRKDDTFEPEVSALAISDIKEHEFDAPDTKTSQETLFTTYLTQLDCQVISLPGAPFFRIRVLQGKTSENSDNHSVEAVSRELHSWTQGKLDILDTEIREIEIAIAEKDSGRVAAKFKYRPNSNRRYLPEDPVQRDLVERCISSIGNKP